MPALPTKPKTHKEFSFHTMLQKNSFPPIESSGHFDGVSQPLLCPDLSNCQKLLFHSFLSSTNDTNRRLVGRMKSEENWRPQGLPNLTKTS